MKKETKDENIVMSQFFKVCPLDEDVLSCAQSKKLKYFLIRCSSETTLPVKFVLSSRLRKIRNDQVSPLDFAQG